MKIRLDQRVHELGLADSREEARRLVLAGKIRVDDAVADKPGRAVPAAARVERIGAPRRYVGRGGLKLEAALDRFPVALPGADGLALDVGASTGGFTDCLLQRGVGRVLAVDTGRGQIHQKLRADPRVELFENTNARDLTEATFGGRLPSLVAVDVSFISLKLILPAVARVLAPGGELVALVKPQFEAGRGQVGSGGIVRDPAVRRRVLEEIAEFAGATGWRIEGWMASPIAGADGNREFLAWARRGPPADPAATAAGIDAAMREASAPPGGEPEIEPSEETFGSGDRA